MEWSAATDVDFSNHAGGGKILGVGPFRSWIVVKKTTKIVKNRTKVKPSVPAPAPVKKMREIAVQPWQHLVRRQHPWRKQLYIKGRNMTARQLVGSIKANELDEEQAARNYHLAVEAIREALAYVKQNKGLLETETEIERLMLQRSEVARGPQAVS